MNSKLQENIKKYPELWSFCVEITTQGLMPDEAMEKIIKIMSFEELKQKDGKGI